MVSVLVSYTAIQVCCHMASAAVSAHVMQHQSCSTILTLFEAIYGVGCTVRVLVAAVTCHLHSVWQNDGLTGIIYSAATVFLLVYADCEKGGVCLRVCICVCFMT